MNGGLLALYGIQVLLLSLFIVSFWARRRSVTLRVLSQIIIGVLLINAVIYGLEEFDYVTKTFFFLDRFGISFWYAEVGSILVSSVIFMALCVVALIICLSFRRWGHASAALVLGGGPCVFLFWVLMVWNWGTNNEIFFALLFYMPPLMLPLLVYSLFFAPSGAQGTASLIVQVRPSPE
jgi:hypothetical protein